MIRNIVFDMGQVLIDWKPAELIRQFGLSEEDSAALMLEIFGETEWVALDDGTVSEEDALKAICGRLPEHLHPYARILVCDWWKPEFHVKEGIEQLIRDVKAAGYGVYLLSNANTRQAEYCTRLPGWECFDGRVTSAELNILKPDERIYKHLLQKYDLKAEECFMIDDSPANVYSALKCGFRGAVFHDDVARLRKQMAEAGIAAGS